MFLCSEELQIHSVIFSPFILPEKLRNCYKFPKTSPKSCEEMFFYSETWESISHFVAAFHSAFKFKTWRAVYTHTYIKPFRWTYLRQYTCFTPQEQYMNVSDPLTIVNSHKTKMLNRDPTLLGLMPLKSFILHSVTLPSLLPGQMVHPSISQDILGFFCIKCVLYALSLNLSLLCLWASSSRKYYFRSISMMWIICCKFY